MEIALCLFNPETSVNRTLATPQAAHVLPAGSLIAHEEADAPNSVLLQSKQRTDLKIACSDITHFGLLPPTPRHPWSQRPLRTPRQRSPTQFSQRQSPRGPAHRSADRCRWLQALRLGHSLSSNRSALRFHTSLPDVREILPDPVSLEAFVGDGEEFAIPLQKPVDFHRAGAAFHYYKRAFARGTFRSACLIRHAAVLPSTPIARKP
jgi:hypothetical protein